MPQEYAEIIVTWLVIGGMLAACIGLLALACQENKTTEADEFDRQLDEFDQFVDEMEDFDNVEVLEVDRGEIR